MLNIIFSKINRQIVFNENLRINLLKEGKINDFKKTYSQKFDVKNFNDGVFWDNAFSNAGSLSSQGAMTKDKIFKISEFIPHKKMSILDIGIGQGFIEELLTIRNIKYNLFGIDFSKNSIKRAKKLFRGTYKVGNILKLDNYYKSSSMDMILALELFEHIDPSRVFKLYQMIYKILKKDGLLLISIPLNENLHLMKSNPSAHVRAYSLEIIKTELDLSGFRIISSKILYAFENNYRLKKIVSTVLPFLFKPNSLIIIAKKTPLK